MNGGDGVTVGCHLEQKTLTPKIWGKMASKRLCVCRSSARN
jgi:NAD(P)H-hydrate repair Nnr-like enzyme with NAD(P)H-hydrate epimerase domain